MHGAAETLGAGLRAFIATGVARSGEVKRLALGALAALAYLACGSPAEAPRPPTAPTSSRPSTPSAPVEARRATPDPNTRPRPTLGDGTRARRAVEAGRHLVASGDHVAALVRFEEALALAPSARLRCEAGYVAFRAGELERADQLVGEALVALLPGADPPASMRAPTAMCLYNAGLVHEARGRPREARDAYARSLALRPNATVEAHLAALAPAPRAETPSWATGPATTSFESLATAIADERCERTALDCERPSIAEVTGAPPGLESAILSMPGNIRHCSQSVFDVLAVRAGDHLLVAALDTSCVEDAHGWESQHQVAAQYDDVLPGGALELVVSLDIAGGDEPLDWRTSEWFARRTIVCTLEVGPLACIWLAPGSGSSHFESMEAEADGDENGENHNDERTYAGYAAALRFVGGRAVFERDRRYPDAAPPDAELRPLFTGSIGRWPDDWDPVD